jgi:hypothetical protein
MHRQIISRKQTEYAAPFLISSALLGFPPQLLMHCSQKPQGVLKESTCPPQKCTALTSSAKKDDSRESCAGVGGARLSKVAVFYADIEICTDSTPMKIRAAELGIADMRSQNTHARLATEPKNPLQKEM